jgi:hypothetical protein
MQPDTCQSFHTVAVKKAFGIVFSRMPFSAYPQLPAADISL